jgi:hypothetical protein
MNSTKYRGSISSMMTMCDYFILTILDIDIITVNVVQETLHIETTYQCQFKDFEIPANKFLRFHII